MNAEIQNEQAPNHPTERWQDEADVMLTKRQLAKRLNKSPRTIELWVLKGYLPAIKLGHSTLFCWPDVLKRLRTEYTVNAV